MRALREAVQREIEDLNLVIYHVLRGGVVLSVLLVGLGLALGAVNPDTLPMSPLGPGPLAHELLRLSATGFLSLGVVAMILTPVARVLLSILAYVRKKDRPYVLVTAIVLVNLLVGMLFGLA